MGTASVLVGCPHRLRGPIGPNTAKPCAACAAFGVPPRWAIALTVDRPRLAERAVAGVEAVPPPPRRTYRPPVTPLARAIEQIDAAGQQISAAARQALSEVRVNMGPLVIETHAAAASADRDVIRMTARQRMRFLP